MKYLIWVLFLFGSLVATSQGDEGFNKNKIALVAFSGFYRIQTIDFPNTYERSEFQVTYLLDYKRELSKRFYGSSLISLTKGQFDLMDFNQNKQYQFPPLKSKDFLILDIGLLFGFKVYENNIASIDYGIGYGNYFLLKGRDLNWGIYEGVNNSNSNKKLFNNWSQVLITNLNFNFKITPRFGFNSTIIFRYLQKEIEYRETLEPNDEISPRFNFGGGFYVKI